MKVREVPPATENIGRCTKNFAKAKTTKTKTNAKTVTETMTNKYKSIHYRVEWCFVAVFSEHG